MDALTGASRSDFAGGNSVVVRVDSGVLLRGNASPELGTTLAAPRTEFKVAGTGELLGPTSAALPTLESRLSIPGSSALALSSFAQVDVNNALRERNLVQAFDRVREQVAETKQEERGTVASTAMVSTGLSVGYVLWLARGGVLVASLMSAMPAWAGVDPLPVLAQMKRENDDEGDGDDPLEKLFTKAKKFVWRKDKAPDEQVQES